jgi:hypothetical protein
LQLREAPSADHKAVDAIIGKIEVDMLANGASLTLSIAMTVLGPMSNDGSFPNSSNHCRIIRTRSCTFGRIGRSSLGPTFVWCSKRRTSSGVVSFLE